MIREFQSVRNSFFFSLKQSDEIRFEKISCDIRPSKWNRIESKSDLIREVYSIVWNKSLDTKFCFDK